MVLLLIIFLVVECFGYNQPGQGVPLSTLNFTRSRIKSQIKFNQACLDRLLSHIYLFEGNLNKLQETVEGFIKYGTERNFTTETIIGQLEEIVGPHSWTFDSANNQTQENPETKIPRFKNEYPIDIKVKISFDPSKFGFAQSTDLSVVFDHNYQKVQITPAMAKLIKQMMKKTSINE